MNSQECVSALGLKSIRGAIYQYKMPQMRVGDVEDRVGNVSKFLGRCGFVLIRELDDGKLVILAPAGQDNLIQDAEVFVFPDSD